MIDPTPSQPPPPPGTPAPSTPRKPANSRPRNLRLQLRLPRTLLLWWSVWLLAAWVLSFGWSSPLLPSLRAYGASVGKLLVLLSIGLAIVWPLFRLSAQNRGAPRIVALVDFVAIVVTLQVILWPMRISGQWEITRLFALNWTMCAWALLIAAVIAFGSTPPSSATLQSGSIPPARALNFLRANTRRAFWMLICVLISILGPIVSLFLGSDAGSGAGLPEIPAIADEAFLWSPIASAWWISGHTLDPPGEAEWLRLSILTGAGMLIWVGLLADAALQSRRRHRENL